MLNLPPSTFEDISDETIAEDLDIEREWLNQRVQKVKTPNISKAGDKPQAGSSQDTKDQGTCEAENPPSTSLTVDEKYEKTLKAAVEGVVGASTLKEYKRCEKYGLL